MRITISLIYGSVRRNRQGIKAARYLESRLKASGIKVNFIDPLEYNLPMLDMRYKDYQPGEAPKSLEKLSSLLSESDGFLIVTGEYNHSIPPALKNLLDHFQSEYMHKPSAIACYSSGSFGGVSAADHLRVITGELGMPAIPRVLPIPLIESAFDEEMNLLNKRIESSATRFINEFTWYIEALKNQREKKED